MIFTSTTWAVLDLQSQVSNCHLEIQVAMQPLALQWPLIGSHTEVDHVAPRESCSNSVIDIKPCPEDALCFADMSTMTNATILGIGACGQVLDVLRLSLWNLPRDDKGVAGTGGNGDNLVLCRINLPFLREVPVEPHQEVPISSKVVGTNRGAKCEALLVHAVSEGPQTRRTQLREVALHHL